VKGSKAAGEVNRLWTTSSPQLRGKMSLTHVPVHAVVLTRLVVSELMSNYRTRSNYWNRKK